MELASGNYIQKSYNIILMRALGYGKTWIPNAFGNQACRQHYRVRYLRQPELLDEFALAKNQADGSFRKLIKNSKRWIY